MNKNTTNNPMEHIDNTVDRMRNIFQTISNRIEDMKPGTKIPATSLAEEIGKNHGMTGPQLYPLMLFLIKGYPGIEIRRGAHGGIFKLTVTNETSYIPISSQESKIMEEVEVMVKPEIIVEEEDKTLPIINT